MNSMFRSDFSLRRQMLLQRLDVLVQSFLWSPMAEGREMEILNEIKNRRASLSTAPCMVTASDVFKIGQDTVDAAGTRSCGVTSTGGSVKGYLIGDVPDRGGRADEV